MQINSKQLLLHFLRILTGAVFIFSAVAKMIGIDNFEIYIFEQQYISFNLSAILARVIISAELMIGALLIGNLYFKKTWLAAILLLSVFSAFLLVQIAKGASGNCNCFGQLLPLTPVESLIKNLVLIGILIFIRKEIAFHHIFTSYAALFIVVFSIALPPVLSPPDFLTDWSKVPHADYDKTSALMISDSTLQKFDLNKGKHLVCFYSVTCQYCMHAADKMNVIIKNESLTDATLCVFTGDEALYDHFLEESNSDPYNHIFLPMKLFFKMAGPSVPAIFLVDDGTVMQQYNYRSIDEKEIKEFFNK